MFTQFEHCIVFYVSYATSLISYVFVFKQLHVLWKITSFYECTWVGRLSILIHLWVFLKFMTHFLGIWSLFNNKAMNHNGLKAIRKWWNVYDTGPEAILMTSLFILWPQPVENLNNGYAISSSTGDDPYLKHTLR